MLGLDPLSPSHSPVGSAATRIYRPRFPGLCSCPLANNPPALLKRILVDQSDIKQTTKKTIHEKQLTDKSEQQLAISIHLKKTQLRPHLRQ